MLTYPGNSCWLFPNRASVRFIHELTLGLVCLHSEHSSAVGVVLEGMKFHEQRYGQLLFLENSGN